MTTPHPHPFSRFSFVRRRESPVADETGDHRAARIGRTGRPDHLGAIAWPRDARHDPILCTCRLALLSAGWRRARRWCLWPSHILNSLSPTGRSSRALRTTACLPWRARVQKNRNPLCSSLPLCVVQVEPARLPRPGYCARVPARVWRCSTRLLDSYTPNTQKRTTSVAPTNATRPDEQACQTTTTLEIGETRAKPG